ncbi:RraA family protein, partial [Klebsiella pneumoniae]
DMAGENDVIVVSNEGDRSRALMGEIMVAYAHHMKNIAGIVLDGPIRDIDALSVLDFPLYATGSNPAGPFKMGPGEV